MRFDLNELFHRIETTHPNPYSKRSKAEVDTDRQKIYAELDQSLTMIDFYKKVAPLVNSLGDSHTNVALPDDVTSVVTQSELFLPLTVQMQGEQAYVTANYSDNADVEAGVELLEINNIPIDVIYSKAKSYDPLGSEIFPPQFWLIFGSLQDYSLKVLLPGQSAEKTFTVRGMTFETLRQKAMTNPNNFPREALTYAAFPNEKAGLLTINNFEEIAQLIEPAFIQIQEDDVQNLIIDVRANSGGKSEQVDSVMSYLTDIPYRFCSWNFTASSGGNLSAEARKDECGFKQPFTTRYPFRGKIYLLVGSNTYSNGIGFAAILQDHNLAVLIGEKTDDRVSGCGGITIPGLKLPRTGLNYYCSTICFVRPNGVLDDQPMIPDYVVETTVQDQLAGRDPVLDYALDLIRKGE